MQNAGKCALGHFILDDRGNIIVGITRMDNDRQPQLAGNADLHTETLSLFGARRVIIEVIKPSLADGDTFGMIGSREKGITVTGKRFICRLMRVHTSAEPHIVMSLGDFAWSMTGAQLHTNRDDLADAGILGARQHPRQISGKLRVIKMRVAVDDHRLRHQAAPSSM